MPDGMTYRETRYSENTNVAFELYSSLIISLIISLTITRAFTKKKKNQ